MTKIWTLHAMGNELTRDKHQDINRFLAQVAATPKPGSAGRGRLLFAMDATASREPTWDTACQIQGQMFTDTAALGGLSVKLCYYRGFREFRASEWVNEPAQLARRMTAVRCLGGATQIARVLEFAIAQTRITRLGALVFVGDCMEEDLDRLCDLAGRLGVLGVRAFMFQEGHDAPAERTFRDIAKLTRGAYCHFDSTSARQLSDLLSAVAVFAAGGHSALRRLPAGAAVRRLTQQLDNR